MTFLLSLLENAGVSMLLWGANIAVFAVVLCLTGQFWQCNAAPALRRARYCVAIYLSIYWLPEIVSSLLALLNLCLPGVFPETLGVPLSLPAVGHSAIPTLRVFNWAAALGAAWLLGALVCAAIRIVPRLRFRKWLRQNRRPLGKRAARILQKVMTQMDEAENLRPGELLDESPRPLPAHPHPRCAAYTVPGLPGPMCVMSGNMRCLLLDKEDYDRETLEAIFRHELSHLAPRRRAPVGIRGYTGDWRLVEPRGLASAPLSARRKRAFLRRAGQSRPQRRNPRRLRPRPD